MRYLLSQIAEICGGELFGPDRIVEDIMTDSRRSGGSESTLFVATKGRNHDSHNFIEQMSRRSIESFIVEHTPCAPLSGSYIVVENSLQALQSLAAHHRSTFTGKVVAIIGSNGKTVVKEWAAQSYSGQGKLFHSPRSYNSQLGVALSLLMSTGHEDITLIEAGISRCKEMEALQRMVRPDVVVITSIGDAHQSGFDSLEQKISEKMIMAREAKKVIYHSHYTPLKSYLEGCGQGFTLIDAEPMRGGGMADATSQRNSQITEALLLECGCNNFDLTHLEPVAMRLEVKEGLNDSILVNDSYNSCVNSLSIAIDTLNSVAGSRPTTLILSPILQSSSSPERLYQRVAKVIAEGGIKRVIGVGGQINKWLDCTYFSSTEELLAKISREDFASRAVLLKGNRSSRFERVAHALERRSHTTRLEVDLDAMIANLNYFRSKLEPTTKLIAMVKASGYGAGDYEIAQTLQDQGVDSLAVAFVDEGVELRERGITMPIIVLNADDDSFTPMIHSRLEPEIYSLLSLQKFIEAIERNGERGYPIHIKIDSGMHRLGLDEDQIEELTASLAAAGEKVYVASIFSHLSCADQADGESYTLSQIALFEKISEQIISRIGYRPMLHIANSAAIERFPSAHADCCRLGIGLYGFGLSEEELTPIATLKSRIVQIKEHAAGTPIGYGGEARLTRPSRIATVPIGYADGLDRRLGYSNWEVRVHSGAAPITGRVCMDSVMIDITDIEGTQEGDEVTIFSAAKGNSAADMAKVLGTIPYEILTSISKRVKRVYLKE